MELAPDRPNVELRRGDEGAQIVVLGFPYDAHIVNVVRGIPGRRFDWEAKEWWAPVDDWVGVHVAEVLERFPDLSASEEVDAWLAQIRRRWVGHVSTVRFDGRGWWVLATRAGTPPEALMAGFVEREGMLLAPLTVGGATALADEDNARLDAGANRCVEALLSGELDPPPARLTAARTFDGERLRLDVLWDPEVGTAFCKLPGADARSATLPIDPWVVEPLDAFIALHDIAVDGPGAHVLDALRIEHEAALATIRHSRSVAGTATRPSINATLRCGSQCSASRCQLSFSDAGQTTIAGNAPSASSAASASTVLPSPCSSAMKVRRACSA